MTLLNIGEILTRSKANGPGIRSVVWVQGCSIQCKGCTNLKLWSNEISYLIDPIELIHKLKMKAKDIEGITLTGGEPFDQSEGCSVLLQGAKYNGLSTVLYTGYTYRLLQGSQDWNVHKMLSNTDILIDGPFQQSKAKDKCIRWTGSSNQKVNFLTERYNRRILFDEISPNEEIHFDSINQTLVHTGIRKTQIDNNYNQINNQWKRKNK